MPQQIDAMTPAQPHEGITALPKQDWGYRTAGDMFVDGSGDRTLTIKVGRKVVRFEFSERFGPLFVGRNGEPLRDQSQGALFAIQLWLKQGRRVKGNECVWEHAP